MSPRRSGSPELSRPRILQAARALFVQKGYRRVSMRDIGHKLGYSHGVLYYHFRNKAELFASIVQEDFKLLNDRLHPHEQSEGASRLEQVMLELIRFGLTHKAQYEMMFMIDEPELRTYVEPIKLDSFHQFAAVVQSESPSKPHEPPDYMLPWMLFISLHGFVAYYLQTDMTFEEVRPLALKLVGHLYRSITT